MDLENQKLKAELLASKIESRRKLFKVAKGCLIVDHPTSFILILFLILSFYWLLTMDKSIMSLATGIFCFLVFESSYTNRRITALIELIGEEELLKGKTTPSSN